MIGHKAHGSTPPARREGLFEGASASSWVALVILLLVGLWMYSDRHVVVLQADQIKASLALNDLQIGLIQGLSVAIFAAVVGYPIAWAADRFDRRLVLALSVLTWSVAIVLCGLARTFAELFLAGALVGAGEAALLPISYAVIPDLFKGRSRLIANATITVVGRIGAGLVIALSGLLVQHVGEARPWLPPALRSLESWRLALFAIALPGPLFIAALSLLRLRERHATAMPGAVRSPSAPVMPFLSRNIALFVRFYLGVGTFVFGISALGAFLPVVVMRQMGETPASVGAGIGVATLVSTIVAMGGVVAGASWLQRRFGQRYPILLLSLASLVPALIVPLFLLARSPMQIYGLLGIVFVFLSAGTMAFPTALQDLTPRLSRARLMAISILINIVLSAIAPAVVGALSDRLRGLSNGLMIAIVATAVLALLVSAALLISCIGRYLAGVAAARDQDTRDIAALPA